MKRAQFLAGLVALPLAARAIPRPVRLSVIYPNLDGLGEGSLGYRVLRLALEKSGRAFQLALTPEPTTHVRARQQLMLGEIDVVDFGTSADFEHRFQALYFPIDRGLNGWRLFVIRDQSQARFASVRDLAGLRQFSLGQGHDWSDVAVLQAAGLKVQQAGSMQSLFRMLSAGRFDAVPLGLNEVQDLMLQARGDAAGCTVEGTLALTYPFARMLFVRRGNEMLRDALQVGLQRAFDDGSFAAQFHALPGNDEAALRERLSGRRILRLPNPTLSAEIARMPARYFFRP